MIYFYAVLSGIMPASLLVLFIYLRDHYQREPMGWILRAVWYGMMACAPALFYEICVPDIPKDTMLGSFYYSFCVTSLPEELAKYLFLWLLVAENKYFDERMDGIVYAACIGMGFAGLENVAYMISCTENRTFVALARALFSVPGHFFYAVFMGFHYSLAVFGPANRRRLNYALALIVPIVLHGIFDLAILIFHFSTLFNVIAAVLFVLLCGYLWTFGHKRIAAMLAEDNEQIHHKGKASGAATLAVAALLLMPSVAQAREYGVKDIPNVQLADSAQLLSNPDSIVADSAAQAINRLLLDIRHRTTAEVAAVVVGDFDGDDVDEFATELFKAWGIGKKGQDNGVLLFVAKDRRQMAIRTGYGVEGVLPDIVCGHIIKNFIAPEFKEERYGEGLLAGVGEMHRLMTDPAAAEELQARLKKGADGGNGLMFLVGLFGIFGIVIWLMKKYGKKDGTGDGTGGTSVGTTPRTAPMPRPRSTFGGGTGGGRIGGSFGGGSTGGGGARGSW